MKHEEIKLDALVEQGMKVIDNSALDSVQENSFQGHSLPTGAVVMFPEDHIVTAEWPIRTRPGRADYALFEKRMEELKNLQAKENPTEDESILIEQYSALKDANDVIPKAKYIIGVDPATNQPVPVLVSYLNRIGRRTADGKGEPVDQLSSFLSRKNNASERRDALKGRTIVVDDDQHTWYMRVFGKNEYAEKSLITINIKDEATCKVDQPVKAE